MDDVLTSYRVRETERRIRRECAELVFHYPQYMLEDATEMPDGDRRLLLTFARLQRTESLIELATVIFAAQSKAGYKKKTSDLEGVIKDLTKQL
jgi:hypothetical protein